MFFTTIFIALTASTVYAAPLHQKRIQQTISASTAKWEQACLAAGGGQKCNPLSVTAFTTLLAAAGPCEQQDAADSMIELAQSLNNDAEMIRLTQIFIQQPRNTPNSVSIPYCQTAPKSPLLSGLFQCQFQGASATTFVGGLEAGAPGTVPFGLKALTPLGSCKANPSGPIADGAQLVDLQQDPGVGSDSTGDGASGSAPETPAATSPAPAASSTGATTPSASGSDFRLQNGLDAQKLNAKFKTLTAGSSCTEGEQACVGPSFAQCVSGAFVLTPCSAGTVCAALPLVNKPGTSISCDTSADVDARIAATGAQSDDSEDESAESDDSESDSDDSESDSDPDCDDSDTESEPETPAESPSTTTAGAATSSAASSGGFKAQNGLAAQKLNAKFKTLTADSKCTDGEQACIGTAFAQCVSGSFAITQCSAGTICAALPLVNKPGTSIACDTAADVEARIVAAGVAGGITGL